MRKKKIWIILLVLLAGGFFAYERFKKNPGDKETVKEVHPFVGAIQSIISSTGTVLPKNRLQVKPPVNGRVETVLVKEGETVKPGQILAWMSSTDRAALLDAARGKDEATLKYWQDVYKPIALLSPIEGEVIVATTQPGQTVTTSDAVVVLSDHLIVQAQVDETDIGKIALGQAAVVALDAYPDAKIKAQVEHIYYESQTVNNVTMYLVDLLLEEVPSFFRSGMNASVDFVVKSAPQVLLLPVEAVMKGSKGDFVLLKEEGKQEPVRQVVKVGMTDDKNYEILSGLSAQDTVLIRSKKLVFPQKTTSTNPFMPARPKR